MPLPAPGGYEFGPYRIDAGERLLRRGDELISLPPKVANTLLVLVRSAGRMVDKTDLMKAIWPDTFVEEGALTRNISLLRKTLGDTGDEPTYIETVPRRGYRFVATVRTVGSPPASEEGVEVHDANPTESPDGEPAAAAEAPPVPGRAKQKWKIVPVATLGSILVIGLLGKYLIRARNDPPAPPALTAGTTLAVLPFRSIDNGAAESYFADGMTQALISSLANLGKLRVVSLGSEAGGRTDSVAWNTILRDQSVNRVLTGTILRSRDRVRVDAQLIDPATRAVHWAKSYDREAGEIMTLESELAEAIAGEIQVRITAEDRGRLRSRVPAGPEALDAYLHGRYLWNRRTEESLRRAVQKFQRAIADDPNYALAYTGLADSYSLLGSIGTDGMAPNEAMPLAKRAAQKALELEPDLADAHVSLAYILFSYDWDLPGAAREFSRALALNPNSATGRHWYSHYFMAAGDLPKASEQMQLALQLEPLSPSINLGVGWCYYYSQQYDRAIDRFRSVAEIDTSLPLAHQTLGMAYQQKGQLDQAIEEFKRAAAFSANSPASVAALASAYAAAKRTAEARAELASLEQMARTRYVPGLYFASVHYAMGDLGATFRWGWQAVRERCDYLMYLRVEPRVGRLAAHPEFIRAMAALQKQ